MYTKASMICRTRRQMSFSSDSFIDPSSISFRSVLQPKMWSEIWNASRPLHRQVFAGLPRTVFHLWEEKVGNIEGSTNARIWAVQNRYIIELPEYREYVVSETNPPWQMMTRPRYPLPTKRNWNVSYCYFAGTPCILAFVEIQCLSSGGFDACRFRAAAGLQRTASAFSDKKKKPWNLFFLLYP